MEEARSGSSTLQILLPCSLILALALSPPETRGESAAGCSALIVLLTALTSSRQGTGWAGSSLVIVALSWPLAAAGAAPGVAVPVLAGSVLAVATGFGAARLRNGPGADRWIAGTLVAAGAAAGLHGLLQRFWTLPRLAAELAERSDVAYRQEILDRALDGRAFAAFSTPAALGGFMALVLPVTLVLAWNARGRRRMLPLAAVLLQVGGLVAAASATALVALAAALALAGLVGLRSRTARRLVLAAVLVLVAGGTLVAVLRGPEILDPAHGNNPMRLRAGNIRIAGQMAADHPWIGVGPGGYGERYPFYRRPDDNESKHVHNLPMELVAEYGIPAGSMLGVTFFVLFLGPLWRKPGSAGAGPPWRYAAAVGLGSFAIHNLADYTAFMPSLLWLAALLRGVLAGGPEREHSPRSRSMALAGLAAVILAGAVTATGGLAWNARLSALSAEAASDHAAALRLADRAVRLAPWNPDARLLRCRLLLGEGRVPEAAEDSAAAIRLAPCRPAARSARSTVRQLAGDLPGAWSDAAEAARLYPADPDYRVRQTALGRQVQAAVPDE